MQNDSSLNRIKSYVHWIKQEKDPGEDRLLMANDIAKLIEMVDAAEIANESCDSGNCCINIRKVLKKLND